MSKPRLAVICLLATLVAAGAVPLSANAAPGPEGLSGVVQCGRGPVDDARVYAYRVAGRDLTRAITGTDGSFLFRDLPAGVYKIIAHKSGFVPAVALLARAASTASDYVEFELIAEARAELDEDDDFWSVRRKIPGDVLRDIRYAEAEDLEDEEPVQLARAESLELQTSMLTGIRHLAPASQLRSIDSSVGLSRRLGRSQVELEGTFSELKPTLRSSTSARLRGETLQLRLNVDNPDGSTLGVSALEHSMSTSRVGRGNPISFEHYQLDWGRDFGDRNRSTVSLMYMEEANFHRQGMVTPVHVPNSSAMMRVHGSFDRELSARHRLRTGVSYQEVLHDRYNRRWLDVLPDQTVDAYGIANSEVHPGVLVEYGVYTTLRDGSVAVSPHGGLLFDMGRSWQANATVRHRLDSGQRLPNDFALAHYSGADSQVGSERHYYRLGIQRKLGRERDSVEVGLVHREIADTLRLFFGDDFFDQVESLYLVRGDEIPEVQLAFNRTLAPGILARLQTTLASGGGGRFMAGSRNRVFENRIRYLVTSIDTHFERTETGVFLAFHRVEQALDPLALRDIGTAADVERLRLRLTQQLGYFLDLGPEWAVLLDVELSRGSTPFSRDMIDPTELRSQIAGGLAVKF